MGNCGIISNFGVNFSRMSASGELEPHPSCPGERCSHLTAFPASDARCAGAELGGIGISPLVVRVGGVTRGGFTAG